MWSILAALHKPTGTQNRCTSYTPYKNEYNFNCISYPPTLRNIDTFERHNSDISVNVYTIHDDKEKDLETISGNDERDETTSFFADEASDEDEGSEDDDTQSDDEIMEDVERISTDEEDCDDEIMEEDDTNEERYIYPIRVTKKEKPNHVNLLLTEKNGVWHYSAITNFSRLVGSQLNNDNTTYWYCYQCLHGYKRKRGETKRDDSKLLQEHLLYCKAEKAQRETFPKEGENKLEFTNIHKQLKVPFIVYADFESKLVETEDAEKIVKTGIKPVVEGGDEAEKVKKKTIQYNTHIATSFGYKIVSFDNEACPIEDSYFTYCGDNAVEVFLETLQGKAAEIIEEYIKNIKPIEPPMEEWTIDQRRDYEITPSCHICEKAFQTGEKRVPDHCHFTGR